MKIRRALVAALAARAEFHGRLGELSASVADWDRALSLATADDILSLHLGRAAAVARSGDYRMALADAVAAGRGATDNAGRLLRSAAVHSLAAEAINRDATLSLAARASGMNVQLDAALDRIAQARAASDGRDPRRMLGALLAPEFVNLRHPF